MKLANILYQEQNKLFNNVISINMNFGTRRVKGGQPFRTAPYFAVSLDP